MIKNSLRYLNQSRVKFTANTAQNKFLFQQVGHKVSNIFQMTLARSFGQIINVSLPDLGEGTKEATIKEILVKVGQRVEEVTILFA